MRIKMATLTMVKGMLLGGVATLAITGCSGTDVGSAQQPSANVAAQANASKVASSDHAARFVQRFDKNGNGKVELAELPAKMQEHMMSADTNKDGVLSADELKAHAAVRRAEMFQRADKNGDGALDANEVGPEHWEHIKVADADGNGSVTQAELDQAHAAGKLTMERHHGDWKQGHDGEKHDPGVMFQRMDKNGDGVLTADEVDPRFWSHLQKADANGDGKVSKDEMEQARARFHQERVQERESQ